MPLSLDLRTALPVIRAALDAGQLQAQQPGANTPGVYAGPCAVGVCIPEDQRAALDGTDNEDGAEYPTVNMLIAAEQLTVPDGQAADWTLLQNDHDNWLSEVAAKNRGAPSAAEHRGNRFRDTLETLERRYPA